MESDLVKQEDILFYVSKEYVQEYALEKLERYLTDDELNIARKGFESGLSYAVEISLETILTEMID